MNIAILEDNKILLKDLYDTIHELNLCEIVIFESNADLFIEKINEKDNVDALLLDIDLDNNSINGIDVANTLKKPVLFISGKSRDYLNEIEAINLDFSCPVEMIQKPATKEKLSKILNKFFEEIEIWERSGRFKTITIDEREINQKDEILFITNDGNPKNKLIQLTDGKTISLKNFSFKNDFENYGFNKHILIQTHQSFIVNKTKIRDLKEGKFICFDDNGNSYSIDIAENYSDLKRLYKNGRL